MNKLICQCCGGTISRHSYRCEYCGTQYEEFDNYIRITSYNPGCQVLKSKIEIPKDEIEYMGAQNAAEYMTNRLSKNLADALAPYMTMETEYDPCTMRQIVTASVRVINPDYRF